jgi:hypothetical protein
MNHLQSRAWVCPACGPIMQLLPECTEATSVSADGASSAYAAEIAKLHIHSAPPSSQTSTPSQPSPQLDGVTQPPSESAVADSEGMRGAAEPTPEPQPGPRPVAPVVPTSRKPMPKPPLPPCDTFLTVLMWILFVCLVALLWRKWERMG